MQTNELPKLKTLLGDVAECYDRKPPTETAIKNWFDTLHQFPWHNIENELRLWLRTKSKFPVIADIFNPLNERAIDEREARWAATKAQEKREAEKFVKSESGTVALALMKKFLSPKKHNRKQWAEDIVEAYCNADHLYYSDVNGVKHPVNGNEINDHQLRLACEALGLDYKGVKYSRKRPAQQPATAPRQKQELETEGMREPGEE